MRTWFDRNRAEGGSPFALFLLLAFGLACAACSPRDPVLAYKDGVVMAAGWRGPEPKDGWRSVLQVRASDDPTAPLLLGAYEESGGVISFTPRFQPLPGVALHVAFHPPNGGPVLAVFGEKAEARSPTAAVTGLFPSTDEWPENTLRMYVEFSHPMAAGDAYAHISVRDDNGRAIEDPFVAIEPELWDREQKRLTLLFDPGRIKRGLVDNRTSGPPLMAGRTVTIEVDPAMRDALGLPLREGYSRTIHATGALREPVDARRWRIEAPSTREEDLLIAFDRPLNHAIAPRAIEITRNGARIDGEARLEDDASRLRFSPASPWSKGDYLIVVDGAIEDLAGNRLGKAFDVDTSDPTQSTCAAPSASIPFHVEARSPPPPSPAPPF